MIVGDSVCNNKNKGERSTRMTLSLSKSFNGYQCVSTFFDLVLHLSPDHTGFLVAGIGHLGRGGRGILGRLLSGYPIRRF